MSRSSPSTNPPLPEVVAEAIGWLTEEQMVEVDRVMIEDLGIQLIQMMENAGRNLAELTVRRHRPAAVTVLAGSGGNGGGGLVAARHLANRGVDVTVTTTRPAAEIGGVPGHQLEIVTAMGIPVTVEPRDGDVIVDTVIGYSLHGPPRGRAAELIDWTNRSGAAVISLDTPSGLDVTAGSAPGAVVTAGATMTLALPKKGLRRAAEVGDLYLADISVPPSVYERFGVANTTPFRDGPIVRVVGR